MSKMSIADAAIKLGVSKEAIHNRIRRGSLECIVEDEIKYVVITKNLQVAKKTNVRRVVSSDTDAKYYKFLEEHNQKLQTKVEKLEGETKTLRDQKEQMLISEREKIEQIYKDKDEQLKNILNAISSKFLLNAPDEEELVEAEIEPQVKEGFPISLKSYLKDSNISKKKSIKIKQRFKKIEKSDSRIIRIGKKYYINLIKYDYSDLLK
ncbi:DNA-binding protein [Sulfurimonas sp.]|uniref:DNA-binding protein n=1 Tax=Sulfurimonas sp. TaxID=2022749 RepID=UPI002B4A2E4B|nr:DNA-binding protein [Sulfurimonas sp.]